MEQTLLIIKPDAVQRGLVGQIINRFEQRGLRIAAMKFLQIDEPLAQRHYVVHKGKPFYAPLVAYITSAPVVVVVLEGNHAIEVARHTMGATNPTQAAPGTIRADFGIEIGRNLVHGSDSPETAGYEIPLFFDKEEIVRWRQATHEWTYE